MRVETSKLQLLTAAAILVLISGGIAVYAQAQNGGQDQQKSSSSTTSSTTSSTNSTTSSTSTTTQTTTTPNLPPCTTPSRAGQVGRLILPISPGQSQTGSIVFSGSKGCVASISTIGGIFNVELTLRSAKPVTQYNVVLVANGTSYTLGNMVTGPDGSGQMMNQVLLKTGTYVVSIQVFDTSATPGQSTLVMQSAQGTIISAPFSSPANHEKQQGHNDKGEQGQQHDDDNDNDGSD